MERWKPISNVLLFGYEISSFGNLRNSLTLRLLKFTLSKKGYLRVSIRRKSFSIHRLVAIEFIPNPENKKEVNHKDGNKLNNNDWNLEWATPKENKEHAMKNGLFYIPKGEQNGNSTLSNNQVKEIKFILGNEIMLQKDIAKLYNISPSTICAIKKGRLRND